MHNYKKLVSEEAKKLIPVRGVNNNMLSDAVLAAGFSVEYRHILFAGGLKDLLRFIAEDMNDEMAQKLAAVDLEAMRVRDRIKHAVTIRISLYCEINDYQKFLKKILSFCALPHNAPFFTKIVYNISDRIWLSIGDNSTDFNFYTKRLLLSSVYASSLIYFSRDSSYDHRKSWLFLGRRINNVLSIGKLLSKVKSKVR